MKNIWLIVFAIVCATVTYHVSYRYFKATQALSKPETTNNTSNSDQSSLSEIKLAELVNNWEKAQGYQPYIQDDELCSLAVTRLSELKNNWEAASNLNSYTGAKVFSNLSENSARDYSTEDQILSSWLSNKTTKKNLTDYFKYSCTKCESSVCVQILGNRGTANSGNSISTKTAYDPPVHCQIDAKCGGGTTPLKQSECSNSTCCQIGDKWLFYKDKNKCTIDQGGKVNNIVIPTYKNTYVDNSITCVVSYPCTGNTYTYKLLPTDCTNAQSQATSLCNSFPKTTSAPPVYTTVASTPDQALIQAHKQACDSAVADWVSYKENFMNTQYGSYSTSAQAIMALESQRQKIQAELYAAGCSNTISL